jgi:ribosome maturation factor RimP
MKSRETRCFPFLLRYNMDVQGISELVNKGLESLDFKDTFLVESIITGKKIEIFLDSDDYVDFAKCKKLSRWLEAIFDEEKYFGESYILEVSSSGVGRPLKFLRQYNKNIGRIIDIKHSVDKRSKGTLVSVEENVLSVEYEIKVKEGKKNKKVIMTDQIKFEDIIESKIKISFN